MIILATNDSVVFGNIRLRKLANAIPQKLTNAIANEGEEGLQHAEENDGRKVLDTHHGRFAAGHEGKVTLRIFKEARADFLIVAINKAGAEQLVMFCTRMQSSHSQRLSTG